MILQKHIRLRLGLDILRVLFLQVFPSSNYSFPSQFAFTVSLKHTKLKSAEGVVGLKMLNWSDGSLHTCHTYLDLSLMLSLGQPRIGKDPERTTSAWLLETLNSEIAVFQDFFFWNNEIPSKLFSLRSQDGKELCDLDMHEGNF